MQIAITGKGNIGTALTTGLKRAGREIVFGHSARREQIGFKLVKAQGKKKKRCQNLNRMPLQFVINQCKRHW